MYLFSYRDVKKIDAQRQARALAKFYRRQMLKDVSAGPATPEADVIEVEFGSYSEREEPIGA